MHSGFVVFEGKDNVGKSTLAKRLVEELTRRERKACLAGFPSHDGAIGRFIRSSFDGSITFDKRSFLYLMIADAIDWTKRIDDFISQGGIFVADRFATFSAYVYQTEDHSAEDVAKVYSTHPWRVPDIAFLVDAPTEITMERQRSREKYKDVVWENEDIAYNERLRQKYLGVFEQYTGPKHVLDGTRSPDQLLLDTLAVLGI